MDSSAHPTVQTALILKTDRLYAELLRQQTLAEFPQSRVILVTSIEATHRALATEPIDLLVTGVGATLDGDVLDLLARCAQQSTRPRRVLVVTTRREYRLLAALRSLAVDGVFDSTSEPLEQLALALRTVGSGARYWSESILEHMHRVSSTSNALFRLLTACEEVVLSVIGDGCDNAVAARELGLSPATVSTIRRELHRKLGVQHRGQLVRAAAQHGFVRFTPAGVVRPGFAILFAAYHARRAKRGDAHPEALPFVSVGQ